MYGLEYRIPFRLSGGDLSAGRHPHLLSVNGGGISFKCLLRIGSALTFDGDSSYDSGAIGIFTTVDGKFHNTRTLAHLTIGKTAHISSFQ